MGPKRNYSTYQYPAEERYEDNFTRIIREATQKENRETGNSFGNGRMSTTEINDIKRSLDQDLIDNLTEHEEEEFCEKNLHSELRETLANRKTDNETYGRNLNNFGSETYDEESCGDDVYFSEFCETRPTENQASDRNLLNQSKEVNIRGTFGLLTERSSYVMRNS